MDDRRAHAVSALGAGAGFASLAVALPLVVLAGRGSASLAGGLLAANTVAFALGAVLAPAFRVPERSLPGGLAAVAAGGLLCAASGGRAGVLALGALLHGVGMGWFWVGAQASLGRHAGKPGSQRTFVAQYALYVAGTAGGGALTGATITAARAGGAGAVASARAGFLVGAGAACIAAALTWGWARRGEAGERRPTLRAPLRGLALQLPALMLVAAMGMLLSLTPVVLRQEFHVSPALIGLASGFVAAAKAGGSVTAGRAVGAVGSRGTVAAMLGGGALAAGLLVEADTAWTFVALVVAATFFSVGVWPVVVDAALARVAPADRRELSVAWNVREYLAIAAATAGGGFLLDSSHSRTLLLGVAALLLAAGAASALAVLGRPVYAPRTT